MLCRNKRLFLFGLFCFFALFSYVQAVEMGTPWGSGTIPEDVQPEGNAIGFRGESVWDFIENMVSRAASYLLFLGLIVAPLVVLIGAFMIFTAAGDPTKVQTAKKLIFWTIIILVIIILARVAVSAIRYIVSFR